MASQRFIDWIERLAWILIYGGLFGVVIGLATRRESDVLGLSITIAGGVVAATGFALIWVRSRLRAPGDTSGQTRTSSHKGAP
jgi:hypothetical protein